MLFSSCGFISLDNLIPFRVLAWEQSLKDKPLDAKSLESTHSKGTFGSQGYEFDPESTVGVLDSLCVSYMSWDGLYQS